MKQADRRSQKGFSIIELIIVILIMSILVVFAVAQFGDAANVFETQNVARELKVNFERARFDSVKRRPENVSEMSSVVIDDTDTITVSIDRNQDGVLQSTESKTIDFAGRNAVKIVGDGVSYPVTMVFDRRGHVTATNSLGLEIDPLFIVCDQCTSFSDADNPTSYYVRLSPTGTVSMYDNGQSPLTPINPVVSTVSSGDEIEPFVSTHPNAIDLIGLTGNPVPIPSPVLTPTPIATPTPSPSATPTPVACTFNERPAISGCTCQSPMSVNGSGRCR